MLVMLKLRSRIRFLNNEMKKEFLAKITEAILSILPISLIVIILSLIFVRDAGVSVAGFAICSVFLMVGICLFTIGSEMSLMKMGGYIGSHLSKTKKVALMLVCAFLIGTIVTIAEPDLMVLASQVPSINKWVFLITVSVGVGIFLLLSVLRILLKIKIKYIMAVCYGLIAILMFFVPSNFLPICFDASGVTTGPISVPFIMAFGLGIAAVRSGESNENDGFGLLAICSIGPIIAIMIISAILGGKANTEIVGTTYSVFENFGEFGLSLGGALLESLKDVAIVLLPVVLFFLIYNFSALKYPIKVIARLMIGIVYTYVGIVLFFTGVNAGYLPLANVLSTAIATSQVWWIIIPISVILGLVIVVAEPAVHVLNKQVEDLSSGVISKKTMLISMSIGVSISVLLSALKVLFQIEMIYFAFPLIVLCVILTFFIPNHITAIAFDSGGVSAGSIAGSFILPFMQGICSARGCDIMTYGFGPVGLIVLTPILIVELMGLKMTINNKKLADSNKKGDKKKVTVIEFN